MDKTKTWLNMNKVDKILELKRLYDIEAISLSEFKKLKDEILTTHKYDSCKPIDLGLPSKTQWSSCNLGASSPTEIGNFFLTGIPLPIANRDIYDSLDLSEFFSYDIKYKYITYRNNKTSIEVDCDTATILTGIWRMPNRVECEELIEYCKVQEVSTYENVDISGCKFIGPNGNHIFIPYNDFGEGNFQCSTKVNNSIPTVSFHYNEATLCYSGSISFTAIRPVLDV